MNELQIGLIGLGVVAVAGVVAYNTWQEYQHRKRAKEVFDKAQPDVLLNDGATDEPVGEERFEEAQVAFEPQTPEAIEEPMSLPPRTPPVEFAERIEPVLVVAEPQALAEPVMTAPTPVDTPALEPAPQPVVAAPRAEEVKDSRPAGEPVHLLSPAVDYLAALDVLDAAPARKILDAQRDALAQINKPIHWVGYNEQTRDWEPMIDDGRSEYRRIRIGLQMVDRRGAVSERELSVFHVAMHDLADELVAIADMPLRDAALESAAALDQFCAGVDIQIGINVVSTGQLFAGTKLRALAEAAGMTIDAEGRFVRHDDLGNVLYAMVNQGEAGFSAEAMKTLSTRGVTFLLDVPLVPHGERVFMQMVELARRFADVLHGVLVDDNQRPLPDSALDPIRRQVGQCQAQMAARNLPAGGAFAQRLFS